MRELSLTYTPQQLSIFFPSTPARHTIVPKGRRFGATRGAAHACIEWCLEGRKVLWGDTVYGNVDRYVDRYFLPPLDSSGIDKEWKQQARVLKIANGYIDFRSADRPETWEGFGYDKIVLNEAGIILSDPYLYTNAVRPMLLDYETSELYALGVPKGKKLKNGNEHPFFTLYSKVGQDGYRGRTYSSYDNPLLNADDIRELEADIASMDPLQVQQEIYGQFLDRIAGRPFAFAFDHKRHVRSVPRRVGALVYASLDFNVEPFTAIASYVWEDAAGMHVHTFAESDLKVASIEEMGVWLRSLVQNEQQLRITGDRGGMSRSIGTKGAVRLFDELRKELRLSDRAFSVPPNPTHLKSREDCNFCLTNLEDLRIDPQCTRLVQDLLGVEVDADGSIIKGDRQKELQRADSLDCWRYTINTYVSKWIDTQRQKRWHYAHQQRA